MSPSMEFLSLPRQIDIPGKSGARYRYTALDEKRFLPPAGANFVIAKLTRDGAQVFYCGETDNLAAQSWKSELEKVRQTCAAAQILTRLNVTRAIREAERLDLIEEHNPPMNG